MDKMITHVDDDKLPEMLDPRAYLQRINYSVPSNLAALTTQMPSSEILLTLHEKHMLAVPFENLSIHYGQPIILDEQALYAKIVQRHRGGFCYELNGMFAWLLRQLGFEVTLLSAEVAEDDGGYSPAFDHLALQIHQLDGVDWLADVGFGDSFRRPLRFQADVEQDGGDGYWYRLISAENTSQKHIGSDELSENYWILQRRHQLSATQPASEGNNDEWMPQYRFIRQPHALSDFAERCQYQQTSPESHFTQRRICSLALPEGRITLSDLLLITTRAGHREETLVASEAEYRQILAEQFGVVV